MANSRIFNGRTKTAPFEGYRGRIVEHVLQQGLAALWAVEHMPRLVSSMLDLSQGTWYAPLPESTPGEAANSYDTGVLPEPPISAWKPFDSDHFGPEMSERIASSLGCTPSELVVVPKASLVLLPAQMAVDHLASSPSALALIMEMNPQPTECVATWASSVGVFYPVSGSSRDRDGLADLMDDAADASSALMILTSDDELDASSSVSLDDSQISALMARSASVVIGAYDGEGYICWSRATV